MMEEQTNNISKPEQDREDEFLRERMERWGQSSKPLYDPFVPQRPRKNKWISGILSFLIPGTGQLYLGLMQRGLGIMVLFMLDIFAIVYFSIGVSIPLIVLFSLLLPVVYFYNIFDALQQTDRVNGWGGPGDLQGQTGFDPLTSAVEKPSTKWGKGNNFGYLLIMAGVILFLAAGKPAWLDSVFDFLGSTFGALILIGIGLALFFKESMKK
ncbi:hypothetical protein [Paenibacillus sp. tmac-D7]|uniref:hypothetical protein n=1 Tax=Paenibacillus sp. tmac-D7 TaxID=2591462 RepID=UPI00215B6E16|nr:hypothetical protein [Paenibacillus sp. tmac-D7]